MTVIELLVASTLSLVLVGMTISAAVANRGAYSHDLARTRLNQNLRGALDLLSTEMRQAGERLPPGFPAVEVRNNASANSDRLIIRRNLLDEVLTVCQNITTGSGSNIMLSSTATGRPPACNYGSQLVNFNAWHTYRLTQPSNRVNAYIYDFTTQYGQWVTISSDTNNGTSMYLTKASGAWLYPYTSGNTAVYVLREWDFRLSTTPGQTDVLQIIQDQDTANPLRVAFGVRTFRVVARMQSGTNLETLAVTDGWTNLRAIQVTLDGTDTYKGRQIATTLTGDLFPRNILSN